MISWGIINANIVRISIRNLKCSSITQLNIHLMIRPKKNKPNGQQELIVILEFFNHDEGLEVANMATYKYDKERVNKILCKQRPNLAPIRT